MVTKHSTMANPEEYRDLSRPVSPMADNESLNDELPTYQRSQAGSYAPSHAPTEKTAAITCPSDPQAPTGSRFARSFNASQPRQAPPEPRAEISTPAYRPAPAARPVQNLQPTAASPFQFPINALPPDYSEVEPIGRPLAIPQTQPSAKAPFLAAYPPALISFGIPLDSWRSFVDTLSAFLSADISNQALHHATDVANDIGEVTSKRFAKQTMRDVSKIENSARNMNPFGVVHNTVGLTVRIAFRVVGSVIPVHRALWKRPNTPRARAEVYVATANKDWFHSRGLHAWLLDTRELADLVGLESEHFLEAAYSTRTQGASQQLDALREVIGDLDVDAVRVMLPDGSASLPGSMPTMKLRESTLWLVLSQESTFKTLNGEYMGKGKASAY